MPPSITHSNTLVVRHFCSQASMITELARCHSIATILSFSHKEIVGYDCHLVVVHGTGQRAVPVPSTSSELVSDTRSPGTVQGPIRRPQATLPQFETCTSLNAPAVPQALNADKPTR